jgi:signal transduction histidine kinase
MTRFDSTISMRLRHEDTGIDRPCRSAGQEPDHLLRALSHDIGASFMLLENSFGCLKRLLNIATPKELEQVVSHVDACLDHSKRLLGDLAQLARSGGVEMDSARVSLAEVVDEVLFEQREALRERGIHVEVAGPLPDVWCNQQRLKQVMTNLVRNATVHGCDATSPVIHISANLAETPQRDPQGRPLLVIRVHDNGRGIDPEHRDRVFLPGVRLAEASADGSGMGLAIVRKIAEYYGGAAWVDADCPRGAAMMVSLPSPVRRLPIPEPRHPNIEHDGPHREIPSPRTHSRQRPSSRHGRG